LARPPSLGCRFAEPDPFIARHGGPTALSRIVVEYRAVRPTRSNRHRMRAPRELVTQARAVDVTWLVGRATGGSVGESRRAGIINPRGRCARTASPSATRGRTCGELPRVDHHVLGLRTRRPRSLVPLNRGGRREELEFVLRLGRASAVARSEAPRARAASALFARCPAAHHFLRRRGRCDDARPFRSCPPRAGERDTAGGRRRRRGGHIFAILYTSGTNRSTQWRERSPPPDQSPTFETSAVLAFRQSMRGTPPPEANAERGIRRRSSSCALFHVRLPRETMTVGLRDRRKLVLMPAGPFEPAPRCRLSRR